MNNVFSYEQNIGMRKSTKIWILVFIASSIVFALFSPFIFSRISLVQGSLAYSFDINSYVAFGALILQQISQTILFVRFLQILSMPNKLFVMTAPLTLSFAAIIYFTYNLNSINTPETALVKSVLKISTTNNNNLLWTIVLTIAYLILLFISFILVCKPIKQVEKAVERLSDGRIKNEIVISGGKQFKEIEHSLNKINNNYKEKENLLKKTNIEYEKYIPKQFLKFIGKNSVLELELGNNVQKEVTTMFCNIRNSTQVSTTLSLEDNFNYINSYLKVVAPIVRKYNGFIDKYLGDGILAVFVKPNEAIECAHAINKSIKDKNLQDKNSPNLEVGISIHTGEVAFGIVGDESRKTPTIISDSVNFASKMDDVNKTYGTTLIFSKETLNNLPAKYPLSYRYIGSLKMSKKGDGMSIFESLETYNKKERDVLIKHKSQFETAVRSFDMAKFELAKNQFSEVFKNEKKDKVCYAYFNVCEEKLSK